jgi:hypothetical protein
MKDSSYNQDLKFLLQEAVSKEKYCYEDLNDDELQRITALIMLTNDSFNLEYITESDKDCSLPVKLAKLMLDKGNLDLLIDLVDLMIENACKYNPDFITSLLEDARKEHEYYLEYEAGDE